MGRPTAVSSKLEIRNPEQGRPCENCRDQVCLNTGKPCRDVERLLPGERTGTPRRERLIGLDIHGNGRDARRNVLDHRRALMDFLRDSGRRREAHIAERYFWHGLTQAQIGRQLGLSERRIGQILRDIEISISEML